VAGGVIAQATNLGVPYLLRAGVLVATLIAALVLMKDIGFTPEKSAHPLQQVRNVLRASVDNGFKNPPVRWMMLAAPFIGGVSFYVFYAMQPYLLELYGDPKAYGIAGLAAATVSGGNIIGGLLVPRIITRFRRRSHILIGTTCLSTLAILALGIVNSFPVALMLLLPWAFAGVLGLPVRHAYLNGLIDSKQRATVLSFDALMSSSGGIAAQPALGRVADVSGYGASYLVSATIQIGALPFLLLARRERATSDAITQSEPSPKGVRQ
jgi:MFS family permease